MYPRSVPYENSPPPRDNILTVGMPGVTSTRSQMARYTGGDPVTVLCNWCDDPHGPLHEVDKDNNRYTGMPLCHRVRRALRLWSTVVVAGKGKEVDADGDEEGSAGLSVCVTVENEAADTASSSACLSRRGKQRSSPHPSSSEIEPSASPRVARDPAVDAAAKGLVDAPVLYNATCRVAPRLIHGVLPSPEVSESHHRNWYCTLNPLHWILIAKELITGWWFCTRPFQFCYSEPGRTNMGGLRDQATYTREVRRAVHKMESSAASPPHEQDSHAPTTKQHLVLFGVSRGATTCFYSAMKLNAEDAKHVSLVLVEAPFDTLEHVIDASSYFPRLVRWFFRSFCDWRGGRDEAAAYDFDPQEVHLRCPVAFVLSVKDRRVPNACTQALIDRVRRELVPHIIPAVEVLTLQHSRHPCMAVGHKEDQDAYVAFVEALYDRYCPP
ncbi:hypothetical protein ABB37_07514 [Leptomonas pyrrhocoris]|uniref:Uncharacterized protein n=1 Tax=Leptomonas pyrrhocoris TaxID=157538 RepID=A0A0N0DSW7_LEPPY|nr:hypothetical protein ABB37_07514 [Leptomonas pyrrhocoris]KPA76662.1 hypothetical protein ABB37_07514 [Leptomonas pyrrhocoris]|eukprot:XP_015655101.1 hypothetical protein ABB37_07514 [Leptomonas pyrrhocoris]